MSVEIVNLSNSSNEGKLSIEQEKLVCSAFWVVKHLIMEKDFMKIFLEMDLLEKLPLK